MYSRYGMYNQRENYNQWGFCHHFYRVKTKFSTFFFLRLKLRTIGYKKQEKKDQKNYVLQRGEKLSSKTFFFHRQFFTPVFLAMDNFRPI